MLAANCYQKQDDTRETLAMCFRAMNCEALAKRVEKTAQSMIATYLEFIQLLAINKQNQYVIDELELAHLIHGFNVNERRRKHV